MTNYFRGSIEDRFEAKVEFAANSCWLWLASDNGKGYGLISTNESRQDKAHRVSYKLYRGPIPEGLQVLHTCDKPYCVNPAHLFLGTNLDNVKDKMQKGRTQLVNGTYSGMCKLSDIEVIQIQEQIDEGTLSLREIAECFNVGTSTVHRIKMGVRNVTTNKR